MKSASPEEKLGFDKADMGEWEALTDLKAVEVLSPAAASKVRKDFSERIISSRMIRRKKPMPGVGSFKFKSRWCVHGHKDPDSHLLRTFAPTPTVESINLFFQVCLNENLSLAFGDIRNAFGQSDKLDRPTGDIWVEPCQGLNLPSGSWIKLIAPVYGLDDAPLRWHKTLLNFFFSLGFERSLLEPCWLIKRSHGRLLAQVLLEVDDINVGTVPAYAEELKKARQVGVRGSRLCWKEHSQSGRQDLSMSRKIHLRETGGNQDSSWPEDRQVSTLDSFRVRGVQEHVVQGALGGTSI